MKRVIEHPETSQTGRRYWRSLGELENSQEFRAWLEREFPQGASELAGNALSRRGFLRLMGASAALAGLGLSGCRRPESYLVPFTASPEWQIPGRHLHYATALPRPGGALPLVVTTFDGRPIKIEGNPQHPESLGKTDAWAQASILDLYDPERSRRFLKNGSGIASDELFGRIDTLHTQWDQNRGSSLAILADGAGGPTRQRLRAEMAKTFPEMSWAEYEPLPTEGKSAAVESSFGKGARLKFSLKGAKVIFAADCDLLSPGRMGVRVAREFADGRRVRGPSDEMNRLYAAESRFTLTGASADHRLRLPAAYMGELCALIGRELVRLGLGGGGLSELLQAHGDKGWQGVDATWVREAAKDLAAHAGASLFVVGAHQSDEAQALGLAINQALGNFGKTLHVLRSDVPPALTLNELAERLRSGKIETLIILGGNPAYNAPADLDWAALQKRIPTVLRLGYYEDETTRLAGWHIPQAHPLEAWGDATASDGSYLSIQPTILPLFGGISDVQLLARCLALPVTQGPELVQETFKNRLGRTLGRGEFDQEWAKFLHAGVFPDSASAPVSATFNATALVGWLKGKTSPPPTLAVDRCELVFAEDYSVSDGRWNNNGWMQEYPDPITKLTWDNAILLSAATAKALGAENKTEHGSTLCRTVKITVGERSVEGPALVVPGHADFSLTLPLGYGRTAVGIVGEGTGFNAYPLRTSAAMGFAMGAQVEVLKKEWVELAVTQEHSAMEGRALVREAPLAEYRKDPNFTDKLGIDAHSPPLKSFYENTVLNGVHQWGMSIDLTTCTGCNACVVACQAENNIPIVGKDQVIKGREMHWIRIDRYFEGEPEDPQMLMQPVACMHCENAPCETVCPVNATVHSEEGLNVMAYNRCIGTRYCANNCPYKVRRFNFFDYNQRPVLERSGSLLGTLFGVEADGLYKGPLTPKSTPETIKMQKNPNVTVRMRGIMEKCTFCVQRLEAAKIDQKVKAGGSPAVKVPTDTIQTACQQACPTDAIVFGDLSDPASRVAQLKKLEHDYGMLEYLNTRPRLTYLGRLRNPNPAMPGAGDIGMSSLKNAHGHVHSGSYESPSGDATTTHSPTKEPQH
jgi:molybdopterin-containing oxidoreductase family iron-sulfur binding subunit